MDTQDNTRYWEQFSQSQTQEMTAEEWQKRRRRNFRLVGYCVLTMVLSIGAHVVFFRYEKATRFSLCDQLKSRR